MPREPKYAPAREDGKKPYVVTVSSWARKHDVLIYEDTAARAKYAVIGRMQHTYGTVRRAKPADMEKKP